MWFCCLISMVITLNRQQIHELLELKKICGESSSDRIIGGQDAALGQFPWIVQIQFDCNISLFFVLLLPLRCSANVMVEMDIF